MRPAIYLTLIAALAVAAVADTGSPSSPLTDAESLIRAGKCEEAITLLTEIAASDQESAPQALQTMGNCYKALKNWGKAIQCFEKILTYPDSPLSAKDVRTWIMDCYLANNDTYKGLACLRKLIAEYPNDAARFHYIVGRRYQWMHQYAEAAKVLREAIKLPMTDPDAKDAAKRYICCSLSAMDFDSALEYLPVFVSDYPDSIPEVVSKELYRWKFKIPKVIEIIQKVITHTRGDTTELRIGLADCYIATNSWSKALPNLQAIPTNKRSANWHTVMAKCYRGQGKHAEAVEETKQAIEMNGSLELKKLLMEYYRDMRDWENMLAQAKLLQEEWPGNAGEWLMNQGWAYLDTKKYDKAVPIFKEAISRFPDQRWVIRGSQVSLAECLYRLGRGNEAIAGLDDYYKTRPELRCEYLLMYAQIMYYGPRDYEKSADTLRRLISEYPNDPLAYDAKRFLAGVLQTAGRWDEAAEVLEANVADTPLWREWDRAALTVRMADSYFKAKDYKMAANAYKKVLKVKEIDREAKARAMYRRAICYRNMGLPNSARRMVLKVSQLYPDTHVAKQARGTLYLWSLPEGEAETAGNLE